MAEKTGGSAEKKGTPIDDTNKFSIARWRASFFVICFVELTALVETLLKLNFDCSFQVWFENSRTVVMEPGPQLTSYVLRPVFPDDFPKNSYKHCRKNPYRLKKFRTFYTLLFHSLFKVKFNIGHFVLGEHWER